MARAWGAAQNGRTRLVLSQRVLLGAVVFSFAVGGCGSSGSQRHISQASGHIQTGSRIRLVYRAHGSGAQPVTPAALGASVRIMRKRAEQLVQPQPEIQLSGADEITVTLPGASTARLAHEQLSRTAQLLFYDWEPNVIGREGKPAPTETKATGGPNAGAAQFGLTEYQAVLRAAKRSTIIRPNDTTVESGCTPARVGGCTYGSWYLLDTKHEKVLRGPEETHQSLYSEHYKQPVGATVRAVRVNPGTVLVRARPIETAAGKMIRASPNSWYVLNDSPVLTGADITDPHQSFDEGAGGSGTPSVSFGFTPHGKSAFQQVTKEVAHRGQEAQLPGMSKEVAEQHFAVVLDDQLMTTPSIDYTQYPEGIDASAGSQISGGFTINSAQNLANELRAGTLPVRLVLISPSCMTGISC